MKRIALLIIIFASVAYMGKIVTMATVHRAHYSVDGQTLLLLFPSVISEDKLAEALRQNHPMLQANTITLMKYYGYTNALEGIRVCLESTVPNVRVSSALYLGRHNKKYAVPYLIRIFNTSFSNNYEESLVYLKQLTGKDFGYNYSEWTEWYENSPSD